MADDSHEVDDVDAKWTVLRCGLVGMYVLGAICSVRFVVSIPRLFTEDWTWMELFQFPFQVVVLGFLTGATTGLLLPLAKYGRIGHAIVGAGCANVYLVVCFAMFETAALLNPRLDAFIAFTCIATFMGGAFGLMVARDIADAKSDTDS